MKIFLVLKNWIGDVLFELPAMEMIRSRYPDAEIIAIGPARCREVLEAHPAVTRFLVFDEKKEHRSFWKRLQFIKELRREKADQAYLFHRSRSRAFMMWLAGVKERIGYGTNRKWLLTRPVAEPHGAMHHVDYFAHMLTQAGFPRPAKAAYHFYFSSRDRSSVYRKLDTLNLKTYACFHLGANWEPKRWPARHFAVLADLLWTRWQLPVIVTGAPADHVLFEEMKRHVQNANVVSLIGETSLGELGALFERAAFVVSGDSGPMHIAAGAGARLVALFGPTDPKLTGPRGIQPAVVLSHVPQGFSVPWYGKNMPEEWLGKISPDEVFRTIEEKNWVSEDRHAHLSAMENKLAIDAPPKILVITLTNIGDVIMTTPVMSALLRQFPGTMLDVVVSPKSRELLSRHSRIKHLFVYDKKAPLREKWNFLKRLRHEPYDIVVDLRNTAIPFLVRTKKRSPLFRRHRERQATLRHLEVLKMMGLESAPARPFEFFHRSDERELMKRLRYRGCELSSRWIVVAPIAASGTKSWAMEGFRQVLDWLLKERAEKILLVGDMPQRLAMDSLTALNPERIYNVAGETSLPELAVLVSQAALVLTNDSGVMHLAYELDRPTVAIFGPTDFERYGRSGPHFRIVRTTQKCLACETSSKTQKHSCMNDIAANDVFKACLEIFASGLHSTKAG